MMLQPRPNANLPVVWTKHLKDKTEADAFADLVKNSIQIRDRLKQIISEEIKQIEDKETTSSVYDTPGWEFKQAHLNGMKDAFKRIDRIL